MDTDGLHHSEYNPSLVDVVPAEAAHLLRHRGFTAAHTFLIGGVVPSLLVLDPATNRPHLGTTDLDLCLGVAIVEGDTAEYERIETALRNAGYEPTDDSFRRRQADRLRLQVEFFCPASDDRPSGRLFRPKAAENPTAKQNFSSKLTAIALDAGYVIGDDVVVVAIDLPDGGGRTTFRLPRHRSAWVPRRQERCARRARFSSHEGGPARGHESQQSCPLAGNSWKAPRRDKGASRSLWVEPGRGSLRRQDAGEPVATS